MSSTKSKDWKAKRSKETGAAEEPGNWVYVQHPTHSDWYNLSTMLDFIGAAERAGVNPLHFTALGLSESGLGNLDYMNPARLLWNVHPKLVKEMEKIPDSQPHRQRQAGIDYAARYLADQHRAFPNDLLSALQAYSGRGRTVYGGHPEVVEYMTGSRRSFGKPFQKIDYWKEKPQAIRILELSSALQNTPELEGLFPVPLSRFLGRY